MRDISLLGEAARAEAQEDRIEEIKDLASSLERRARDGWKLPVSFVLSIAGAAWSVLTDDPIGPLISGGQELLCDRERGPADCEAYSYLFRVKRRSHA